MHINKNELFFAEAYIKEHFDRIIDWSIGDIKRCCRMKNDGTCEDGGALVGAFILWCCAIDYFGGLYTGLFSRGDTKRRFRSFISKYMSRYDADKINDLRWSLLHYYSPRHYVLYHENNFESNKNLHLTESNRGILLHLGWSIKDLEDGVKNYYDDLKNSDELKIKVWRYYREQLPIMPVKVVNPVRPLTPPTLISLTSGTAVKSVTASGSVSPIEWFINKK